MQFYLNGYAPGDPDIRAAAPGAEQRSAGLPDDGRRAHRRQRPGRARARRAAVELSRASRTRLVERRDGPLELGQADGVACRTVEMFEAFGLSDEARRARPTG